MSVPASASLAFADPSSATALPVCANAWKKKIVASSVPPWGARADPVRVLGVEAEFVAFGEALESAVNDEVGALVSAREGHLKAALACVHGGRGIRRDEVLLGDVDISIFVDIKPKNFLTMLQVYVVGVPSTTARQMLKYWHAPPWASAPRVFALLSTRIDIIAIKESESHVLSFTNQAQYKIVPIR